MINRKFKRKGEEEMNRKEEPEKESLWKDSDFII